jgi:gliding motility-associated lipoprotein GldH
MIKNRKLTRFIAFLLFVVAFSMNSCDSNAVFDDYQSFDEAKWNKDNIVSFDLKLDDTLTSNNIYINIRNTVDYPFSNLYLFSKVYFPNGKVVVDTLEYEMTDDMGEWLGDGVGELKDNLLFYKKDVVFYEKGEYKITLRHGMRVDDLEGVKDLGVRIEKNQNKK